MIEWRKLSKEQWENFVRSCPEAIFYQSPQFVSVFAHKGIPVVLGLLVKGKIEAIVVGGIQKRGEEKWLHCPFSAGFGGICWRKPLRVTVWCEALKRLEHWARQQRFEGISIVLTPWFYYSVPDDTVSFSLMKSGYRFKGGDLTAFIAATKGFTSKARQNVRHAEKLGAVLVPITIEEAFVFIEERKKEARLPVSVTRQEMDQLVEVMGDKIGAWGVLLNAELVAALIVQRLNSRCTLGFMWAHHIKFSQARVADFLIVRAGEAEFKRGARVFDLGTVTVQRQVIKGVEQFKRKLGACHALRPWYIRRLNV